MGSKASHMVSSESPQPSSRMLLSRHGRSLINRGKLKLSSLFCGAFNPKSTFEAEDCPEKLFTSCRQDSNSSNGYQNPSLDPSSIFSSEVGDNSSMHENQDSSGRNSNDLEDPSPEHGATDNQASMDLIDLSNNNNNTPTVVPDQPSQESVTGDSVFFLARESPSVIEVNDRSPTDLNGIESHQDSVIDHDDIPRFEFLDIDRAHSPIASATGFPSSESEQNPNNLSQLHLDLVSISFDILSTSIVSRRNSRRPFWDAFERHWTRRTDSISLVNTTDLADDRGTRHRWRHDLDTLSAINHQRRARRRESELCPSGQHRDGVCYCHMLFTAEESRSLASISRIVLLAEALFEVLDEINQQSMSLSLSTLTLPAPVSLVDAFPIKHHHKNKNAESNCDDIQQCHICLADYEEEDRLRVLPCNHEYHVPCIDKWLKEVNRVCPLCRRNVCDDPEDCSVSNTQVPLLQ